MFADIPFVDRLTLTTVVDGTYLAVLPDRRGDSIVVERTRRPRAPSLIAEHGLAYHLASERAGQQRQMLLDFGLTSDSLLANLTLLGIQPDRADALVLSHGHGDHYGGLLALAQSTPIWIQRDVPFFVGGEDTFSRRWTIDSEGKPLRSEQLQRAEVEDRGPRVIVAEEPTIVGGHLVLSGQIPRVTDFETGLPNARLELGAGNAQTGELVPDPFAGEIAAVYAVRDRGVVVISSCGHAGIINTVRHAQQITGLDRVHAVVGGWHLAEAADNVISRTVNALVELEPDFLIPMHCTGFSTMARLEQAMPGRVIEPSVGTRVIFGT